MSEYKHILTDFKDLRKVIGEITKTQPAKSRYQQQAEKMKYSAEAEPKDDKDGEDNKKPDHAGEEEIKKAYLALGKSAQGSIEFQRGLVQKELAKMGYKTYSKQAFSDLFGVESNDLDEWTISDVEIAMKKKYGKIDKEAIAKLKKVQHMGNVDRNALVKVGHGKLLVQSVEIEVDLRERSFSIKNKKTGQVYALGKYPFSKNHLEKIRKAGGDHKHAAFYKDGKLQKEEIELDEANYEIKNGKVYISKKEFAKVSKDYKGKNTMTVLDPKTRSTVNMPVVFEEVDLDEGRMKELHGYIEQGKSAEWIAKKMKVDLKTIKVLMGEEFIPSRSKQVKEEHEHAKQSPFKLKSQQYPRAIPIKTDGFGNRHATVEDIITACDSFGMIIDKELQVEQVQKELGKKGFISFKQTDLDNVFDDRETVRMILALESDIEKQTLIEYTRTEIQYALDEGHEIEFLKPDRTKSIGPVLKLSGNTFNVKDKYTGKSFTYKYSKIEEKEVKTFSEVSKERGPRQLINPNKEVMIVKKKKVIVIDKKDQDKYLKQGWSLAEETNLDEWISTGGTRRRVKEGDKRKLAKLKEWEDAAEASGDKEAYQKFFNKVLKKFGVSSPAELEDEKKKEFFNYIDKNWKADHEEVDIHKSYKVDGRRANFREKMKKLGYIKSRF